MKRWHMAPKRFFGALELAGRSVPVRFTVSITSKGVSNVKLDEMPFDASTMFISDAYHDQQGEMRFVEFTLAGQSKDGVTFHSESVIVLSFAGHFSESTPPTMSLKLLCSECKIVSQATPAMKTGVRILLRGFSSFKSLSAQCGLGELELRGATALKPFEQNHLTGSLAIEGPPEGMEFTAWREEVDELLKHVRVIMSFARGAQIRSPVIETVWNGRVELVVRQRSDDEGQPAAVFTPFNYESIFRQAVASHFFEKPRAKEIRIAIEWFTMRHGYREAKLTSAMTVLENLLTSNLSRSDIELRKEKQASKLRATMLGAAKLVLQELGGSAEEIEEELATMRDKLEDINRRPLKEKIHILAKRWGVPMDGISDKALGAAKRARDHIVHRGQYISKDSVEDLMNHVHLARELVVRFILTAIEFEGRYASPLTGDLNRPFKRLPPKLD